MTHVESLDALATVQLENDHERVQYRQMVADLLLTWDANEFFTRSKQLLGVQRGKTVHSMFPQWLGSPDIANVWRAVGHTIRYGHKLRQACHSVGVKEGLVREVRMHASTKAYLDVMHKSMSGSVLEPLSEAETLKIVKSLHAFARSVTYRKLRFLVNNDQSIDLEDLAQHLLTRGLITMRRYDHFRHPNGGRDILKITNYAKRSIHNEAMSVIRNRTSSSRQVVMNTKSGCGVCKECESGVPSRCLQSDPEYARLVVSMDASPVDHDSVTMDSAETMMDLHALLKRPHVAAAVKAVFGTCDVQTILDQLDDKKCAALRAAINEWH